jgi:hypothetical protein
MTNKYILPVSLVISALVLSYFSFNYAKPGIKLNKMMNDFPQATKNAYTMASQGKTVGAKSVFQGSSSVSDAVSDLVAETGSILSSNSSSKGGGSKKHCKKGGKRKTKCKK